MEHWPSCEHRIPCVLKTGTRPRPGRTLGKSFYICSKCPNDQCQFVKQVYGVPPMTCPVHGEMVDVRVIADSLQHTVRYRCNNGIPWCGIAEWGDQGGGSKENIHPKPRPQLTPARTKSCEPSLCNLDGSAYLTALEDSGGDMSSSHSSVEESRSHILEGEEEEGEGESVSTVGEEREEGESVNSEVDEEEGVSNTVEEGEEGEGVNSGVEEVEEEEEEEGVNSTVEEGEEGEGVSSAEEEGEEEIIVILSSGDEGGGEGVEEDSKQDGDSAEGSGDGVDRDSVEGGGVEYDSVESDGVDRDSVEGGGVEYDSVEYDSVDRDGVDRDSVDGDSVESDGVEGSEEGTDEVVSSSHCWEAGEESCVEGTDETCAVKSELHKEAVCGEKLKVLSHESECSHLVGHGSAGQVWRDEREQNSAEKSGSVGSTEGDPAVGSEEEGGETVGRELSEESLPASQDCQEPSVCGSMSGDLSPGGHSGVQSEGEEQEEADGVVPERPQSPQFKLGTQYRTLYRQLHQTETLLHTMAHKLPDGGEKLRRQRQEIMSRIGQIKKPPPPNLTSHKPAGNHLPGASADDKLFRKGINLQTRLVTAGVVEQLHSSLESCPGPDALAPQPAGVTVSLFPHQRRALAWLLWRERQRPSGGILADEMGLGKTLSMIALILQNPSHLSHHEDGLVSSRATLVVCASSLIHQWEAEIASKVQPHCLSVLIYHGSRRTKHPNVLAANDVVITTYDTVGFEGAAALHNGDEPSGRRRRVASCTTLFQVYWHRIILDEAHKIRNPKTAMAIGVTGLKKIHRWAVTGTPVQNKLTDLYSLVRFLELAPFDDVKEWKRSIERKSVVGIQRLRTVIAVLVLRRMKDDIAATQKLPEKLIQTHIVDLEDEEQNLYDALFSEARKVFVRFLAEHNKGSAEGSPSKAPSGNSPPATPLPPAVQRCLDEVLHSVRGRGAMLVMLLRLRQCCCHPALMVTGVHGTDVEEGLEEALQSLTLGHVPQRKKAWELPSVFREQRLSTKSREVLREVQRIRALDPPEKCIIVSQWKSLLDIIKYQLDSAGISNTSIDGRVPPKQRNRNMTQFNAAGQEPSVMLLSMIAGGEGLNLVGGNHVFMLDLHWNPAVELQATDRAHRVGQTRDVYIHRFVCRSTVEERIQLLQRKKLELSEAVLSGASQPKRGNRLTLEDLKVLFHVD